MTDRLLAYILPLVGVVLGAAGTFAGQYLATRETRKQARSAAETALRSERKEAVLAFLEACQQVEAAAEHLFFKGSVREEAPRLTHQMWYRCKCLELVCGTRVRKTAVEYADRLMTAAHDGVPGGAKVWVWLGETRGPFLKAAKDELGIGSSSSG